MILLLFLLYHCFLSIHCKYFPELDKVVQGRQYDPECVFNYTEINSKTIKKFPKCEHVYAIIVINNNTDLTVKELKTAFRQMNALNGGVRIENTTFQNISLFTPPKGDYEYVTFDVEYYGFIVRNNSDLIDANALWDVYLFFDGDLNEVEFRIENNPKLNTTILCAWGYIDFYTEIIVQGNLEDCACNGGIMNPSSIPQFSTCEKVFSGVKLYNISDATDLSPLENVNTIRGTIDIRNTNLQNLSFFVGLEKLRMNSFNENPKPCVNLFNNSQMTRLGIPNLKEISHWDPGNIKKANFERLHPEFCLTIEEIMFLLENLISFSNLHAKVCIDNRTIVDEKVVCYFESMSMLPENCQVLIGDLVINPGSEDHFPKLKSMIYLIGALAIQNTSLQHIEPLYTLRYIMQLDDSYPVIQIVGNKQLAPPMFRHLENIVTRKKRKAVIQDNDRFDYTSCVMFNDMDYPGPSYRKDLEISGYDCGERVGVQYRYPSGVHRHNNLFIHLIIMVLFFSS
uniref:Recep_L_domain domain-containing protein n=1 Tax=Caenorhabditis tropicalis TaxID=1561998 RepID=A0A1I7TY34_9PELO